MEGYLWLYIFLLAALPWWWRINHHSCLFPEWCSAVLLNTTASLNLNVHSSSAATQDKANQHQMPPRWTYCLALESFTLTHLLINIIQANHGVCFLETTFKPRKDVMFSVRCIFQEACIWTELAKGLIHEIITFPHRTLSVEALVCYKNSNFVCA